uniref:transposase n=1 Tax=Olsenella massiliensis TaxID=1622075 RepID=UPI00071C1E8C|nr:transposase [Olsenella massiliensis]
MRLAGRRRPPDAELLEDAASSALAYLDFPREHVTWARTNNVQERMNCEAKRRTRVVQAFPSFGSLVRLVGAVCCDQNDAWLASRNFIGVRSLDPGYGCKPLPEEPGGVDRALRLVGEAFDRKRRVA